MQKKHQRGGTQRKEVQSVIRTHGIEVIDEAGVPRIKIGMFAEGPGIRICDETGHARISLGMSFINQPGLFFYDQITTRLHFHLSSNGEPVIGMIDETAAYAGKILLETQMQETSKRHRRQPQEGSPPGQANGKEG